MIRDSGHHRMQRTHLATSPRLCGRVVDLATDVAIVELQTDAEMTVDGHGLVHGGFLFGLADYAAMLAVNHPYVVLGAAETRFLKPVRVGEAVRAEARLEGRAEGRRRQVNVKVWRGEDEVFSGSFQCFVLDQHVLELRT